MWRMNLNSESLISIVDFSREAKSLEKTFRFAWYHEYTRSEFCWLEETKLKLLYRTLLNNREEASTSHNTRWSQTSQNVSWSSENDTGKFKSSKMKQNLSTLKDRGNNLLEKKNKCNKRKEFLCEYSLEMWRSITAPFFNLKSLSMLAL